MYKKNTKQTGITHKLYHKIWLIMRLTTVLLIASLIQVSAATFGQKITLNRQNAPLKSLFKEIRKQSGFSFYYDGNILSPQATGSVNVSNATVEEALQNMLSGLPLSYEIKDKLIIITKKKTPSFLDNLISSITAITVRGIVVDSLGSPLPGAAIRIKNSTKSTSADSEGKFYMENVSDDAILQVSYIGYITRELRVSTDMGRIILIQASNKLDEVNVQYSTGYQTLPKERATGSFSYVSKEKLDSRISTNIIDKLDGLASGLIFNKDGRGNRKLSVRGKNTIEAKFSANGERYPNIVNSDPLIILDNFPYDGDLNNINPNDVEDITILKDAAASSIWGSRSGNGVIVITTKKGRMNMPLNIEVNINTTLINKPDLSYDRNYLSSPDFISVQQELYNRGNYTSLISDPLKQYQPIPAAVEIMASSLSQEQKNAALNELKQIDIRDQVKKYFYQEGLNQQCNIAARGGGDRSVYAVSVGYDKNRDNVKESGLGRWTVNTNLNFSPIKNLEVGGVLNIIQSTVDANYALSDLTAGIGSYLPYTNLGDENGNALRVMRDYNNNFIKNIIPGKGFLDWTYRPLDELRNRYNTGNNKMLDYRFAPVLKYRINNGLNATLNYQYENQLSSTLGVLTADSYQVRNLRNRYATVANGTATSLSTIPEGGIMDQTRQYMISQSGRFQLNYDHRWGSHVVNLLAGAEAREVIRKIDTGPKLYGYDADRMLNSSILNYAQYYNLYPSGFALIPQRVDLKELTDRSRSFFINGAYTFRDKYTFSGSARSDAANIFGVKTNQKYVPLWSVGAKWDINKEAFYKITWLPILKLRATYGFTGNLPGGVSAYTITTASATTGTLGIQYPYQGISAFGNEQLRWEKIGKANVGFDFGSAAGRITGSLEYFYKRGRDMIGLAQLSAISGTTSLVGNFSDMKGSGYDIVLNVKNIDGEFRWNSGYLLSYATDQVTRYYDYGMAIPSTGFDATSAIVVGYPVDAIFSIPSAGLDPGNGEPRGYLAGKVSNDYVKILGSGTSFKQLLADGSWKYNGSSVPTYFGAWRNTFEFHNFTLSANISFKAGYYFRRRSIRYSDLYGTGLGNVDYLDRWQKPGDESFTDIPSFPSVNNVNRDNFFALSETLVERGDHIRLQDINFSYVFDRNRFKTLPFKSIRVSAYMNNVGILWRANKHNIDPDYVTYFTTNPNPRTYSLGLQASF